MSLVLCCGPVPFAPASTGQVVTFQDARDRETGYADVTSDERCGITGLPVGKCECWEWDPDSPAGQPHRKDRDYFLEYVRSAHKRLGL